MKAHYMRTSKKQVNSSSKWDEKGVMVPGPDEFLMRSKIPRWIASTTIKPNCTILDLGCSDGGLLEAVRKFQPNATLTGVDYSSRAVESGQDKYPRVKFVKQDLMDYAKAMPAFDFVIINHTLEHFSEPQELLDLVMPKCKYLVIGVPFLRSYDCPEHLVYFGWESFDDYNVLCKVVIEKRSFELLIKGGLS